MLLIHMLVLCYYLFVHLLCEIVLLEVLFILCNQSTKSVLRLVNLMKLASSILLLFYFVKHFLNH